MDMVHTNGSMAECMKANGQITICTAKEFTTIQKVSFMRGKTPYNSIILANFKVFFKSYLFLIVFNKLF